MYTLYHFRFMFLCICMYIQMYIYIYTYVDMQVDFLRQKPPLCSLIISKFPSQHRLIMGEHLFDMAKSLYNPIYRFIVYLYSMGFINQLQTGGAQHLVPMMFPKFIRSSVRWQCEAICPPRPMGHTHPIRVSWRRPIKDNGIRQAGACRDYVCWFITRINTSSLYLA